MSVDEPLSAALRAIARAESLPAIMSAAARSARALLGSQGVTFVLRDGDRCYYAEEDAIAPLWKGRRFLADQCISGWVMQHQESVVIADVHADPRIPADIYRPTFVTSLAMVPVGTHEALAAVGAYWANHHVATAHQLAVLQLIADASAVALVNEAIQARASSVTGVVTAGDESEAIVLDQIARVNARAAGGMDAFLDDAMGVARMLIGPPKRVPNVDLGELTARVARELQPVARVCAADLRVTAEPISLAGDPEALEATVRLLIGAAIKAGEGDVHVEAFHAAGTANVVIRKRVASAVSSVLDPIVQSTVEQHGGRLRSVSSSNGLTFVMTLPTVSLGIGD